MTVYNKKNPESIQKMFNSIAKRYDVTNGILSFQMHRMWNRKLRDKAYGNHPHTILDLCAGTGDIILPYLEAHSDCSGILLDFSSEMLECAKIKGKGRGNIRYIQGDAMDIPLPDHSVSAVSIAYGIRNVSNPQKCIQEARRVLEPGGTFAILELTQPQNPLLRLGHKFYLHGILPIVGRVVTANQDAYHYLCNSIQSFIPADELGSMMQTAGFQQIEVYPLSGGIATIIIGK